MIKRICILMLTNFLLVSVAQAQEYMFTYSKLFSQLKYNAEEQFTDVKVGVFFLNADTKQLCTIEKAWMEKEKHYEEIAASSSNELLIPLDNNLRSANPLVFIQTPKDTRCDYSVVVMSRKPLEGKVLYSEAIVLLPQMQEMLETLGGMFASFFTPDVEGLTLEFAEQSGEVRLSDGNTVPIANGRAQVRLSDIAPDGYFEVPYQTTRVLPWLPSAK